MVRLAVPEPCAKFQTRATDGVPCAGPRQWPATTQLSALGSGDSALSKKKRAVAAGGLLLADSERGIYSGRAEGGEKAGQASGQE